MAVNMAGKGGKSSAGYAVLCFANRDYDRLLPLLTDLTRRSVNLWRGEDPKKDADVFKTTVAAIDNCNTFVLFLSRNALTSKRVMYYELDYALKTRPHDIYPVIIEDGLTLPPEISSHFAGRLFLHRAGGTDKDLEEALFRHFCEKGCHPDYPSPNAKSARFYEEYPHDDPAPVVLPDEDESAQVEFHSVIKRASKSEPSVPRDDKRELPVHPDFDFTRNQNGATITGYKGSASRVEIPAKIFGYGVNKIAEGAFSGISRLEEIALPASIMEISADAFKDCSNLTRIVLPPNVEKIGSGAFRNCTSLPTVVLPSSVTEIGANAFDGCTSLSSITLPHRVVSLGEYAFNRCASLGSVSLPDSLTAIDPNSFANCSKKLVISASKDSMAARYALSHDIKLKKR